MMGLLLPLVARLGIPERYRRAAAIVTLIVGVLLLCGAVWGAWSLWLADRDKDQREIGARDQREDDLRETLERTEQGNETRANIEETFKRDGRSDAIYAQCLRTARTPANCQRFMPDRQKDQR